MRRRVLRLPAALLALTGLVLVLAPPGAGAATLDATGWWWRAQSSSLPAPLPPPPDVSAEQLLVQGQPEGATAVAGVRYTLNEGEESPVLTIKPTEDSTVPETAMILACRAVVPWEPVQAGAWENQPLVDCATSVQGVISPEGITFAVAPLQSGPTVDVVLVPGRDPAGPPGANGSVFSLKFAKPGPEALATSPGSTSTGGTFSSSDTPMSSGSFDGTSSAAPTVESPAFAGSSETSVTPSVTPAAEAALPPQQQASPGATGFNPQAGVPAAAAGADDDDETRTRTLGFIVLVASAGILFWSSAGAGAGAGAERVGLGRFAREAPSGIPAGVPVATGGLGRFTKPRTAPPPRLS